MEWNSTVAKEQQLNYNIIAIPILTVSAFIMLDMMVVRVGIAKCFIINCSSIATIKFNSISNLFPYAYFDP